MAIIMERLPYGGFKSIAAGTSKVFVVGKNGAMYLDLDFSIRNFDELKNIKADCIVHNQFSRRFYAARPGDTYYWWSDGYEWYKSTTLPFKIGDDFSINVMEEYGVLSTGGRTFQLDGGVYNEDKDRHLHTNVPWQVVGDMELSGCLRLDPTDGVLVNNFRPELNLDEFGCKETDFVAIAYGFDEPQSRYVYALAGEKHKAIFEVFRYRHGYNAQWQVCRWPYPIGCEVLDVTVDFEGRIFALVQEPGDFNNQAIVYCKDPNGLMGGL